MLKLLTLALLGIAGIGYSQEIPDGVKKYMYQLQHDPTVEYGFDYAKMRRYIDQKVQFQEWFVGLPAQFYELNIKKLETATTDTKFEDLIEPTNRWIIPIKTKSEGWIYHALVKVDGERFTPGGCGQGVIRGWDDVRKKFPEESGVIPIFIDYPFGLLYFPQIKNGKNIFHIKHPKWDDLMSRMTSNSLDSLDEGRKIIPLLQDKVRVYKGQRKESDRQFENHPANSMDTTGGKE